MMKDYENKISGKGGIWPFLYHLFIIKRIRPSSNQYIHTRFSNPFHLVNTEPAMSSVFFFQLQPVRSLRNSTPSFHSSILTVGAPPSSSIPEK